MLKGPIKQRWLLGLLVASGQLVVLAIGAVLFAQWGEGAVRQIVREQATVRAREYVAQWAGVIDDLDLADMSEGSEGRRRVEAIIERAHLPNEGYLCIVDDADGSMICRPGWVAGEDDVVVATSPLRGLNMTLQVHQSDAAREAVLAPFMRRVRAIAALLIGVMVVFSVLVTGAIVRRYENRLASINADLEGKVERRSRSLIQSRGAVIRGLAMLAESRDQQTGMHLERIGRYVRILATELSRDDPEIDEKFINTLEETSALHDIGKVGVPDDVLKNTEHLTDEQRTIIEKHPFIGGDTLLAVKREWGDDPFLITACEICFAHHERWDGTGYPFGLTGDIIPLSARIVALADVYDALTTPRVYKPAMTHEEAATIIRDGAGTQFDPRIVEAFTRREAEFERVALELADEPARWRRPVGCVTEGRRR